MEIPIKIVHTAPDRTFSILLGAKLSTKTFRQPVKGHRKKRNIIF